MGWADLVLSHSPLAFYRQNEAASTTVLVDSSGNGRNGTYSSSTMAGATGLLPAEQSTTAAAYSGTNEAAVTDAAWMNPTHLTIFAWIKTSTTGTVKSIWDRDNDSTQRQFQFRIKSTGQLEFIHLGGAVFFCSSTTVLTDGVARFVAATFDGANIKVYVNAVQEGITPCTTALPSRSWRLTLGVHGNPVSQRFVGTIDEAAIFGTALTASQLNDLYVAGSTIAATDSATASDLAALATTVAAADLASSADSASKVEETSTPTERTIAAAAENRVFVVPAEDRVLVVPSENRTLEA